MGTTARVLKVAQRKHKTWQTDGSSKPDILVTALSGIKMREVNINILVSI